LLLLVVVDVAKSGEVDGMAMALCVGCGGFGLGWARTSLLGRVVSVGELNTWFTWGGR